MSWGQFAMEMTLVPKGYCRKFHHCASHLWLTARKGKEVNGDQIHLINIDLKSFSFDCRDKHRSSIPLGLRLFIRCGYPTAVPPLKIPPNSSLPAVDLSLWEFERSRFVSSNTDSNWYLTKILFQIEWHVELTSTVHCHANRPPISSAPTSRR